MSLGRSGRVVGGGMRQNDGMDAGMGQIERAAQGVTQLVMQRHPDGAEHRAGQPRAVERIAAGVDVGGGLHDAR